MAKPLMQEPAMRQQGMIEMEPVRYTGIKMGRHHSDHPQREKMMSVPNRAVSNGVLSWLHIGDLHITQNTEQNDLFLKRTGSVDFATLPGDNADDGTPEQFWLVRDAVSPLPMALHIPPGDDFKPCTLDAFYDGPGTEHRPKAKGRRW